MNLPPNVKSFLTVMVPIVLKICPQNLFPSVILAQAALESGWNLKAKTLFGIKGKGTAGSVTTPTTEQRPDGTVDHIVDQFAAYSNLEEAVHGYVDLIMGQNQYAAVKRYAIARNCSTPESMITAIHVAGYATELNYAKEVMSVIHSFNLTQYDAGHGIQK